MPDTHSKIYVGGLSTSTDENHIRKLFEEHGLTASKIELTKYGYAFIDLADSNDNEDAIMKLDGLKLDGHALKVEISKSKLQKKRVKNSKVVVHNFPITLSVEEVIQYLSRCGTVISCEPANNKAPDKASYIVKYEDIDQAELSLQQLNGEIYGTSTIKVVPFAENQKKKNGSSQQMPMYPFRFLIPAHLVGAVIGIGGATVKNFQVDSASRYIIVDIQAKDERYPHEKPVTVLGSLESQIKAINLILDFLDDVIDRNLSSPESKDGKEVPLFQSPLDVRILTHDHLVGRLIGKGGSHLAKIKQDTDTKIIIPNSDKAIRAHFERIVTIQGERANTYTAAEAMLTKLRSSYEKDMEFVMKQQENLQSLYPGLNFYNQMLPGVNPDNVFSRVNPMMFNPMQNVFNPNTLCLNQSGYNTGGNTNPFYEMFQAYEHSNVSETTYLYIHHGAVGAIIGNRGSNIYMIKQLSGAQVNVATQSDNQDQRKVTITGTPEAQWKAQWLISEKIRSDGFTHGDWPILIAEIPIPGSMVGRVIGKQGKKVLELQRDSHAIIEVPMTNTENIDLTSQAEVLVKILGHFWALQSAQRKIRGIIYKYTSRESLNQMSKVGPNILSVPTLGGMNDVTGENNPTTATAGPGGDSDVLNGLVSASHETQIDQVVTS